MSGIEKKIDYYADEVLVKISVGFLIVLAIGKLFFEPTALKNAFSVVIGLYLGAFVLIFFRYLRNEKLSKDEFEKKVAEKSALRSYGFLIAGFSVYIYWKISNGMNVDYNLIYIAATSAIIDSLFRFKSIWPSSEEIIEYGEELQNGNRYE